MPEFSGILTILILLMPYIVSHRSWKLKRAVILPCPEDKVLLWFSWTLLFTIFQLLLWWPRSLGMCAYTCAHICACLCVCIHTHMCAYTCMYSNISRKQKTRGEKVQDAGYWIMQSCQVRVPKAGLGWSAWVHWLIVWFRFIVTLTHYLLSTWCKTKAVKGFQSKTI